MKHFLKTMGLILLLVSILLSSLIVNGCSQTPSTPGLTTTPASTAKLIKWRWQADFTSNDPVYYMQTVGAAKRINEACKGRLEITTYEADSLVPSGGELDSVKNGVFEMATTSPAYWTGLMPELAVTYCPYFSPSSLADYRNVLYDPKWGLMDVFRQSYDKQGVHLIDWPFNPPWTLITKKPVQTVDALKGLKIRTFGLASNFLSKLGASPTSLPYGEIYMAMKLGTIDAATVGMVDMAGLKFMEISNYVLTPFFVENPALDIYVNKAAWDSLPSDLKTILTDTIVRFNKETDSDLAAITAKGRKASEEYGVKWQELPKDQQVIMYNASSAVLDEFSKKTPASTQIIKIMNDFKQANGLIPK